MKATLEWIREFVDFDMDPEELADRLTNIGLECTVDLDGVLDGVVVGQIVEVLPHPRADHLKVCKVAAGSEVLTVICGAPNTEVATRAPLALVGARLPGGLEIGASEIRGVRSEGMLCSEAELEVGDDAAGIWILPDELPLGAPLDQVLKLRDWVLEFDLTPNRSDCLSILGLAYEVAAITGSKANVPEISLHEEGSSIHDRFNVTIRDPELCPRYVARILDGTKVQQSPLWLRRRLQLVGLRPINNLVDVTNYVMWELGQPLHVFDLDLLEGGEIVIQRARRGDTLVSLDGEARSLTDEMLMIWDGVKPVAVAGVMGGENSEVRPGSQKVLIESAYFSPINIRRTAKTLGMVTEASRRFERGIDPEGCARAANRAAQLMAALSGAKIAPELIDAYPARKDHPAIHLRVSKVNAHLGTCLDAHEIRSLLLRLDFKVDDVENGTLQVEPPTRRVDLTREVDLIEEVARMWGFDRIPTTLPKNAMVSGAPSLGRRMELLAREILVGLGFHEIITYAFMDESAFGRFELSPDDPMRKALALQNPIRQDQRVLRTTLLYGLLDAVSRNFHRKNYDLRFFEVGRVFIPRGGEALPSEPRRLAGVITGARNPGYWGDRARVQVDYFDLKGILEQILHVFRIPGVRFDPDRAPAFLRKGVSAAVVEGQAMIGWLGELAPSVRENWDLDSSPMVFEMDFEYLVDSGTLERSFKPLPRYPEVVRDLSVVLDEDILVGDVLQAIRLLSLDWLDEVYLLDVFTEGRKIAQGEKSLTFRLIYRAATRSLTDEEVNGQQCKLIEGLGEKFKAKLRS